MTPEERATKVMEGYAGLPNYYTLRQDIADVIRAAVGEDRRGRDHGDKEIARIRANVAYYVPSTLKEECDRLLAHIDFQAALIHDLRETVEGSGYYAAGYRAGLEAALGVAAGERVRNERLAALCHERRLGDSHQDYVVRSDAMWDVEDKIRGRLEES